MLMQEWSHMFLEFVQDCDSDVEHCASQSGQPFLDNLRIIVVMTHAPAKIKAAIRNSKAVIQDSFSRLRDIVHGYIVSGMTYTSVGVSVLSSGASPPWTSSRST